MNCPSEIHLVLPWPPSANRYWRKWRGRMVISNEARAYRELVKRNAFVLPKIKGNERLNIRLYAFPPDKRKRDIDNLIKVTLDALEKGRIFLNDSQIDFLSIKRRSVVKGGEMAVIIDVVKE